LSALAREGTTALDSPLRRGIVRRGIATSAPSFAAYVLATRTGDPARRRAVAFTSIVSGQLVQTLDLGRAEARLSTEVLGAVAASGAFVAAALTVPRLKQFLGLALPTPVGTQRSTAASRRRWRWARSSFRSQPSPARATRSSAAAAKALKRTDPSNHGVCEKAPCDATRTVFEYCNTVSYGIFLWHLVV